jgi:hypothetical protein
MERKKREKQQGIALSIDYCGRKAKGQASLKVEYRAL